MSSTTEKCREILLRLTKAIETIEGYKHKTKDDNHSKKRPSLTPDSPQEKNEEIQETNDNSNSSVFSLSAYNLLFRTLLELRTKSYTKKETTRAKLIHYNIIKRIFQLLCEKPDHFQAAYENYLVKCTGRKKSDDHWLGDLEKDGGNDKEESCKNITKDENSTEWCLQPFEVEEQQLIPFEDFRDLLLSLLGNFCLDSAARSQVIKHRGITVLRTILFEVESDSIWRRCCRTLANLAVDPACRKAIQATDITVKIISILESSCDSECKSTICRTLRLFADSPELLKTIVDCNGICILTQICRIGTQSVKGAAVKTLAEIAKKNCSVEYGQQVLLGEGIGKLVEMTKEDAVYSENALCILIHLSHHSFMRPAMGSSDAIQTIQSKFESEIPINFYSQILNSFCLFSNEAVNRVKLRQFGILKILLSALQDQRHTSLHNRIISAFVNFLYDDSSFDLLLENGLVPVLLVHLQRCANFSFSMPGTEPFVESLIEAIMNREDNGENSSTQEPECSNNKKTCFEQVVKCSSTSSSNVQTSVGGDPKKGLMCKKQSSAECNRILSKSPESALNENVHSSKTELPAREKLSTSLKERAHTQANDNLPHKRKETSVSIGKNPPFQVDEAQNSGALDFVDVSGRNKNPSFETGKTRQFHAPDPVDVSEPSELPSRKGRIPKRKHSDLYSKSSKRYRLSLDVKTDPQMEPAILNLNVPHLHNLSQLGAETVANMVDMSASSVLSHVSKGTSSPELSVTHTTEIIAYHDSSLLEPAESNSKKMERNYADIFVSVRTKCSPSEIEEILKTKGFCIKMESESPNMDMKDNDYNDNEEDIVLDKQQRNIYCIDSPTYQNNITWQTEDFANDQASTSSTNLVKEPSSGQCLSPLSNASYNSPDWSPDFNTNEKDFSSEDSYSSEEEMQMDSDRKALCCNEDDPKDNKCKGSASENCSYKDEILDHNSGASALGTCRQSVSDETCSHNEVIPDENCCPSASAAHRRINDVQINNDLSSRTKGSASRIRQCDDGVSNDNKVSALEGSASGACPPPNEDNLSDDDCKGPASERCHQQPKNTSPGSNKRQPKAQSDADMANRTTENNILILLSRTSQKENPTKYLANIESFLCLLRYIGHVPLALPRSVRILGRVVSNLFCLESLLSFMAPALIFLELMTSWNRRICDTRCQDEMFWTPSRATWLNVGSAFSISSCIKGSDDLLKAGQLILNEFGVVTEINFGTRLLSQHLMKKTPQQNYVVACLPFLCRSHNVQEKLLVRLRGFDFLQKIVMSDPKSCLSKVIILGLSYLACHLHVKPDPIQPTPFPKCSQTPNSLRCCLKSFEKDTTFVTDSGQKVLANKEQLTQQSDVFSAMLSSNFLESKSDEIAIPDISLVALRFIVHYLHGCSLSCSVIEYIVNPKSSLPYNGIVNILAHADQYMLIRLQKFLVKTVREKYLNHHTVGKFYNVASLHNYDDLRKECTTYCLVSLVFGSKSVSCMMEILTGPYATEFLDLVKKTLKKHSTIDPFTKI